MAAAGGPLKSFSIDGRLFQSAGDADVQLDLGGFSSEFEMNGDGVTARDVMKGKPWMAEGINVEIDHDRDDLKFLQDLMDTPGGSFSVTITLVNDVTYSGRGKPTGDLKNSIQNSTAALTLSGPGKLEQQ